jgi:hypothetical protein
MVGLPAPEQCLFHAGRQLADGVSLADQGIQPDATLQVIRYRLELLCVLCSTSALCGSSRAVEGLHSCAGE